MPVILGLRNALIQYRQLEVSRTIENIVYVELIRRGYIVDIGKNGNEEIDFVARDAEGRKNYIQVTYSIENPSVKERDYPLSEVWTTAIKDTHNNGQDAIYKPRKRLPFVDNIRLFGK